MPKVADVLVPAPPALAPTSTGAETVGQAYTLRVPASASDPLVVILPDGSEHSWTPDAMGYLDEFGNYDYISGSATVSLTTRGNLAEYQHTYPAAVETFIAEPERVKHYVRLDEPPRAPADTLTGAVHFFISGKVGGMRLPTGRHDSIPLASFRLDQPDAKDMTTKAGEEVMGSYEVVDGVGGEQYLYMLLPATYVLDPNRPWPLVIDPTVTTSTSNIATAYSSQRKVVECHANTNRVALWQDGSNLKLAVSTDGGVTYGTPVTAITGVATAANLGFDVAIDDNDNLHVIFNKSFPYYNRATPNAGRTAWTWETATTLYSVAGVLVELQLTPNGTGLIAHGFFTWGNSTSTTLYQKSVPVAADGTRGTIASANRSITVPSATTIVSAPVYLGSTSIAQAWGYSQLISGKGVMCRAGTYDSTGAITWGSDETADSTNYVVDSVLSASVDQTGRMVLGYKKSSDNLLAVKRRALDGTWAALGTVPSVTPTSISLVCDGDDVYVWYTTTTGVYYIKYTAATGSWGSAVTVAAVANANYVTARVDTGGTMDALATVGGASPYNIMAYQVSLNQAPLQPSGLTRAAFDATADAAFTWTHNDPDGDGPTAHQVQIINASTGATLIDTGKTTSVAESYTLPAGTAANGVTYQWRVMTWDSLDVASPWSDYATVTTGAKPVPTITSPSSGGTVSTADVTVQWSVGDQGSATVRRYAADGTTLQDTQTVTSASARARTMTGLSNGTDYQVGVQVTSAIGVVGDEVKSGAFTVSYTPPATPTLTVTPGTDSLAIAITNPTPGVGEPTVTSNDLYRDGVRISTGIAANGTYTDYAVASGVTYSYVVRASGDNGTYADSSAATGTWSMSGGAYLHDPRDAASTIHYYEYREPTLQDNRAIPHGVYEFAGRSAPVVSFEGVMQNREIRLRIAAPTDATDRTALESLFARRSTVCFRDFRGRKVYAVMPELPSSDEKWGGWVDLQLVQVSYDEEV